MAEIEYNLRLSTYNIILLTQKTNSLYLNNFVGLKNCWKSSRLFWWVFSYIIKAKNPTNCIILNLLHEAFCNSWTCCPRHCCPQRRVPT